MFLTVVFKRDKNEMPNRTQHFLAATTKRVRYPRQELDRKEDLIKIKLNRCKRFINKNWFNYHQYILTDSKIRQNEVARDLLSPNTCSSYACVLILIRVQCLGFLTDSFVLSSLISRAGDVHPERLVSFFSYSPMFTVEVDPTGFDQLSELHVSLVFFSFVASVPQSCRPRSLANATTMQAKRRS